MFNYLKWGTAVKTNDEYVLCYVSSDCDSSCPRACWFVDHMDGVWGDDWDDAPYEHNAGAPYWGDGHDGFYVYVETDLAHPYEDDNGYRAYNSKRSVQDINDSGYPWLRSTRGSKPKVNICPGTTYKEFARLIEETGGRIFAEETKR